MTNREFRALCMEKFDAKSHELNARAKKNIEAYRKTGHTLRLLDQNGIPVSGARIRVIQKTHDFRHGANIFMLDEFREQESNERYRALFAQYFNLATVPFFWSATEPEAGRLRYDIGSPKLYRRPPAELCVRYCEENGIMPKLHCLYYDKLIPDWLPKNSPAEMWKLYEKRFAEIAERYAGRMYEFEVTNEMISTHGWTSCSVLAHERDTGIRMWKMAREYFRNETLVINDSYPKDVGMRRYCDPYYLMLKDLISQGASIDKIGVQNHIFCGVSTGRQEDGLMQRIEHFDPDIVIRGLEILSEFGRPLEITEITIPTLGEGEEAEQLQADILRQLYTIWFATPRMDGAVYWNVADGTAVSVPGWDENVCRGGLFHRDMSPKLSALMLKHLFEEEWHTEEELVTDAYGCACFRGFFGDYTAETGNDRFTFGLHRAHPAMTTHRICRQA